MVKIVIQMLARCAAAACFYCGRMWPTDAEASACIQRCYNERYGQK